MKALPLWVKLLGGIMLLAGVTVGLSFVPTNEVAYAPNAPIDMDGKITVANRPAEPLQGRMYLVGVTERKVNLLQRLLLDVSDSSIDFGPAPKTPTGDGPAPSDVRAMDEAKMVAAGIAFDLAGEPVNWSGSGATVAQVAPTGPAGRVLRAGDIVVRVNGIDVDTSVEASRIISKLRPGSIVKLGVQRAGVPHQISIRTVAPRDRDATRSSEIGVELSTIGLRVKLPRDVNIDSGAVVGPSAGLAFSLYLIDSLTPADLLRGRNVVVSGAVAPDGSVLPVGRMRQKALSVQAANRDLMLVPMANAAEAQAAVASACDSGDCVKVVPVRSVEDAVAALTLDDVGLDARLAQPAS